VPRRPRQVAWIVQPGQASNLRNCTIHSLHLDVGGQSLDLAIAARKTTCRLADLVPLASQISQMLMDCSILHAQDAGQTAPCRKGCAACCRYMVAISAPEAQWLWEKVQQLPARKRSDLLARFLTASRRILDAKMPPAKSDSDLESLSAWYQSLNLACPMLESNCCTLYEHRPIVCREFHVLSPKSQCGRAGGDVSRVSVPVSLAECLQELDTRESDRETSVLLPLTAAWATSPEASIQKHDDADRLVRQLLNVIRRRAAASA
jgi:Fe-S-cluster containining protein